MYGVKTLSAAIVSAFMLAACGGGGGGGTTDAPAGDNTGGGSNTGGGDNSGGGSQPSAGSALQGVWNGTVQWDRGSRGILKWDTTAVAMRDGSVYFVSSEYYTADNANERNGMGALLVGKGTAENGQFSFGDGKEYSFEADWLVRTAAVDATYSAQSSFQGRITYPNNEPQRTFATTYANNYVGAASLNDLVFNNVSSRSIQGTFYVPRDGGGHTKHNLHLVVGEDGSLSSRYPEDCNISGRLDPDSERKVFAANITFNSGAGCPFAPQTSLSGVAFQKNSVPTVAYPVSNPGRFHMALTTGDKERGTVFAQILQQQP